MANYNYIGTVGQEELDGGFVTLTEKHPERKDSVKEIDKMTLREIIAMFKEMQPPMSKKEQELREQSYFRERVRSGLPPQSAPLRLNAARASESP